MPSAHSHSNESAPVFTKPINSRARDILLEDVTHHLDINIDWAWETDGQTATETTLALAEKASSVNIPCGVHAGHPVGMHNAVAFARKRGIGLGALVSYPDPAHGGWEHMPELDEQAFQSWVWVQLGALQSLAQIHQAELQHVRPHGALYDAFFDKPDSDTRERLEQLARAIVAYNPWLILVGPFGDALNQLRDKTGVRIAPEVHLGKRYTNTGKPFYKESSKDLAIKAAQEQLHQLVKEGTLTSQTGAELQPGALTCHISGQYADAVDLMGAAAARLTRPLPLAMVLSGNSGWV